MSAERHPLLARIAARVEGHPEAPALICEGETLSYADLWGGAEAGGAALLAAGLAPGDRVALTGSRRPRQFMDLLAVLLAGGIYLPAGERAPAARVDAILADAAARFRLDGDLGLEVLRPAAGESPLPAGYILYTSGSTGRPKGVRITLDNIAAYVGNVGDAYPLATGDRLAQLADLGFDASVHEIFRAWTGGAALCVVPGRHALMWPRYFRDLGIGEALLVPSQVRLATGLLRDGSLPALRRAFLGAETVTASVVQALAAAAPAAALVNLWGPTEATVALTHHPIAMGRDEDEAVPIGRAWPGQTVLRDFATGELLAAGSQLSPGYWNRADEDAARFFSRDGRRFYRTGDLARETADGFVFAGRADRQVKIKGHRVELDECERSIRAAAGTEEAHVVLVGGTLACVLREGIDPAALEARLRATLPAYMVPGRFVAVAALPLTTSGKIDLPALAALAAG